LSACGVNDIGALSSRWRRCGSRLFRACAVLPPRGADVTGVAVPSGWSLDGKGFDLARLVVRQGAIPDACRR